MLKHVTIGMAGAVLLLGGSIAGAAPVTFFGEDPSTTGVLGPNSAAARSEFLGNLTGVGSEDFESFTDGQSAPLNLSFPGSSGTLTAELSGSGSIYEGSTTGRFPTSGTKFWRASTGSFMIDFTDPISAFGFNGIDIGDFVDEQMTLILEDTAGTQSSLTVPHSLNLDNLAQATLFFGFYDLEQTYSSIAFLNTSAGDDTFAFDDMVIGDAEQVTPGDPSEIPVPTSLALLGIGLAGLSLSARRSRNAQPRA